MLASVPRRWQTIGLPGVLERPSATYWPLALDAMPPIEQAFDGTLDWLLATPSHPRSLEESEDDSPMTRADAQGLRTLGVSSIPSSFRRFVEDPEPRRHIRSATACYLDLGQFVVRTSDGGTLVHFLSDQQWVLHWLLYAAPDGSECVVVSGDPVGFDDGETDPVREVDVEAPGDLAVCSDSFEEFLYRYWAEHELFHLLAVDNVAIEDVPPELRAYAAAYPRA